MRIDRAFVAGTKGRTALMPLLPRREQTRSLCFCMASKFHCIRSTRIEIQSMSENASECFASTERNLR